jgi:hypothetical protein
MSEPWLQRSPPPLLQYKESSIEPKDENWFLRMCYYFVNSFVLTVYIRAYFVFVFVLLRDFQDSFDVLSVVNTQIYSGMCCRVVWYEVTIFAEEMCVFISQNSPVF